MLRQGLHLRMLSVGVLVAFSLAVPCRAESPIVIPTPPPEEPDRKDGSGMAVAMAAAGAAVAGLSCAMMMKKANEETDPDRAMMYRMMAMQQCQQAAQSLANAAKNDEGKKQLMTPQQVAQSNPSEPTMAMPTSAPESTIAVAAAATTSAPETESGVVAPSVFEATPAAVAAATTPGSDDLGSSSTKAPVVAAGEESSPLNPIEGPKVAVDENGSGNAQTASGGATLAGGAGGAAQTAAAAAAKAAELAKNGRHGARTANGGSASASGGGDAKPKEEPMDAMLAQLLGGAQAGAEAALSFATSGTLRRGPASEVAQGDAPNIFEFAAFRYHTLSKRDARVGKRSVLADVPKKAAPAPVVKKQSEIGAKVRLATNKGGKK